MKAIKRGFVRTITAPGVSALVVVGLLLTGPHAAWAKKPSGAPNAVDPTAVTGCGTLSASNTIYALTNNITTTGTGDCIVLIHGFASNRNENWRRVGRCEWCGHW